MWLVGNGQDRGDSGEEVTGRRKWLRVTKDVGWQKSDRSSCPCRLVDMDMKFGHVQHVEHR